MYTCFETLCWSGCGASKIPNMKATHGNAKCGLLASLLLNSDAAENPKMGLKTTNAAAVSYRPPMAGWRRYHDLMFTIVFCSCNEIGANKKKTHMFSTFSSCFHSGNAPC